MFCSTQNKCLIDSAPQYIANVNDGFQNSLANPTNVIFKYRKAKLTLFLLYINSTYVPMIIRETMQLYMGGIS